ncbi:hypothetical protein IFM89_038818, partial [Coptis chinensis]
SSVHEPIPPISISALKSERTINIEGSMSTLSCTKLTTLTLSAICLQMLGLSLFIFGFFPIKPTLSGVSGPESYIAPKCNSVINENNITQLKSLYKDISGVPPLFDRLILMVIDGLPAEFVLGKDDHLPSQDMMEAMPYTQSLLSNGAALGYHAKAAPPTVTMPRLKAMVSGAIGGFLDVAFNFNTQAFMDDNLIGQFHSIGWNMVMHGDETWIKLFPGLFTRHDGVSSFFVKDTIEVDHNVSRHLEAELLTRDWNLLILHYLGLDHVGHIGGRKSVLMAPKLNEMDEVIKMIHRSSILRHDHHHGNTLLMVVSDHGMTDSGNHGGSSYEETDSLALFIGLGSNPQDYATATCNAASQVDIVPTLALLFGVPIPKNNVGVLIGKSFVSLTEGEQLRALELNSWQLLRLLQAILPGVQCGDRFCGDMNNLINLESSECEGSVEQILCCLFSKAAALHNNWMCTKDQSLRSNSSNDFNETVAAYNEFLRSASEWLSRTATDKPHNLLAVGIATMLISCMMFLSIQVCLCKAVHMLLSAFAMKESSYPEEEVAALYFLGLTGHFSLGNSNTLATVDVAGAFIGMSSHSTLFSGILMFIITYASPLLCLLCMTMYISLKDFNYLLACEDADLGHLLQIFLGIPSLVPLSINSVMLTTFTVILLLMRNHLFVWSVFSPKYLYVCATTLCIYVGEFIVSATVIYTCLVFLFRKKMLNSKGDISVRT